MSDVHKQFDLAMFEIYRRAKAEAGYTASIFYRMLNDHGGLLTAKQLINASKPSDGYAELHLRKRLDLTVEAMVVENAKWHALFVEEEIQKARARWPLTITNSKPTTNYRHPNTHTA